MEGFVGGNTGDKTRRSLDRSEQRGAAWNSRGVETKLATLGKRALSRHLLQQNAANAAAERLLALLYTHLRHTDASFDMMQHHSSTIVYSQTGAPPARRGQ